VPRINFLPALAALAITINATVAAQAAGQPKVAVLDFSTVGLTSNWYGNFEPGVALSDLVTDQMVNGGKFDVLDRKNIDSTLAEHNLGQSGEVDPASAASAGRLVGARYLISGNILQLDHTGHSGGGAGGILPGFIGAAAGAVSSDRVTLKVAVRVVDAVTGRIVQTFQDEKTYRATSLEGGAWAGLAGGGYSNSNFINSSMGHLINDEAISIATTLDPSKFTSGPEQPALSGHVLDIDGGNVIVNIGSAKGAAVGSYFDVVKVKEIKDPDSGKLLTVNENIGKIEIMSVSGDTSVCRLVSGKAVPGAKVQSE
jgi:curli biogenesis system outer membrane secretion channel CsgG